MNLKGWFQAIIFVKRKKNIPMQNRNQIRKVNTHKERETEMTETN